MNLETIEIMPITNQQDFEEACVIIDALADADLIADPIERKKALDQLEAIALPSYEYEKKHHAIPNKIL